MTIEFLGFPGCPHAPALRTNLRAALRHLRAHVEFLDTNQEKLPTDDLRRRYPSPTILVDGRDLFAMPALDHPAQGCRVYAAGLPSAEQIAERIMQARG